MRKVSKQILLENFYLKMLLYLHDELVMLAEVVRPAHLVLVSLAFPQLFFLDHLVKDVHHGILQLVLFGRLP